MLTYQHLISLTLLIVTISSESCPVKPRNDRSPNNPSTADCDSGFFDLHTDPGNECICCNVGVVDDTFPNQCRYANPPTVHKQAKGTLTCAENYFCCSCEALICDGCRKIECAGDSACIGVKPILANDGCEVGGTHIACNGDFSCFRTEISGECISTVDCNGDNSCGESIFIFNQNIEVPGTINTLALPFNGDYSVPGSKIIANNVNSVTCGGDGSCMNTKFNINCYTNNIDIGCKLEIGGDNSASDATWDINGASLLLCKGDMSCVDTNFNINCIASGCSIQINGEEAANDANWLINYVASFKCSGPRACESSVYTLNCIGGGIGCAVECSSCTDTTLDVLHSNGITCKGLNGCKSAIIKLTENLPGTILCDAMRSCQNAIFMNKSGKHIKHINNIICSSQNACNYAIFNIKPTSHDFNVQCKGISSCEDSIYKIRTDFNSIKSINCNGANSCRGSIISVKNDDKLDITIHEISFNGFESGINAVLNINSEGIISLPRIVCSGERACKNTGFNINLEDGTDYVLFNIVCSSLQSCVSTHITIKRGLYLLTQEELNELDIVLRCNNPSACLGATLNDILFTDF